MSQGVSTGNFPKDSEELLFGFHIPDELKINILQVPHHTINQSCLPLDQNNREHESQSRRSPASIERGPAARFAEK